MTIAAVICEYNPFHNGHAYQLNEIKKRLNADYIVCLMSGNFVQRGEPAIINKEIRTRIALNNGADCVLLLPVSVATGSADVFAEGAVSILNRLGCIDYLVFGSECGNIELLKECADTLLHHGTADAFEIQKLLKEGNTFAKARSILFPQYEEILNKPNNILAVEYIQSLLRSSSKIVPVTISRSGADYNEESLLSEKEYPSATAIRKAINAAGTTFPPSIGKYLPANSLELLERECGKSFPIFLNDFSDEIYYRLLSEDANALEFMDVSPSLNNKLTNNLDKYKDFESYICENNSKEVTYARISRALIHILLNIQGSAAEAKTNVNALSHIKLMGFKKQSEKLLTYINEHSAIKLAGKVPDIYEEANGVTKEMFDEELFASTLYDHKAFVKFNSTFTPEYSKPFIVV